MTNMTDEEFIAGLDRDYPNLDWDKVPDPDTLPDVYVIRGLKRREFTTLRVRDQYIQFEIETEFNTKEEAENHIQLMRSSPDQWKDIHIPSLKVEASKPKAAQDMWINKLLRDDIKKGKEVFPMFGPI